MTFKGRQIPEEDWKRFLEEDREVEEPKSPTLTQTFGSTPGSATSYFSEDSQYSDIV